MELRAHERKEDVVFLTDWEMGVPMNPGCDMHLIYDTQART